MSSGISEYSSRSANLLRSAGRFDPGVVDEKRARRVTEDLLRATERSATEGLTLGFEAGQGIPPPIGVTEGLAAILFDIQAGNLLIATGLRQGEVADQIERAPNLLVNSRQQIEVSRNDLLSLVDAPLPFDAELRQRSSSIESAIGGFRTYSNELLQEIVAQAQSTVLLARDGLSKLDGSALGEALNRIGESLPLVAEVGRLVRRGVELVKNAIEAIISLFGKDTLIQVRDAVGEVWQNINNLGGTLFDKLLGVEAVRARIEQILAGRGLNINPLDRATNALAPLAASFAADNKLLRAIIRAIGLAGALLAWLHAAGPWYMIGLGLAYATAIGAVVLVGRQYTGALPIHGESVKQLAEAILTD
jgi:hypothetical protein